MIGIPLTGVVLGISGMKPLGEFLVRVRLNAQRFPDRQDLEQERKLIVVSLAHFRRHESLVVLDHVEEDALGLVVFGREGGMRTHP